MICKDCIHENVCNKLCPRGLLPYKSDKYPAEKFCLEFINKADFAEVKHGQWIGIDGDKCSECNKYLSEIMDADSYYAIDFDINKIVACPFCGARMDGECK